MKYFLLKKFFQIIKKNPSEMPMVSYWKTKDRVQAKLVRLEDGSQALFMEGEKHPIASYPREHILFNKLSKLKHEIKNQIFNESWRKLEEGEPTEKIIQDVMSALHGDIKRIVEEMKYDMVPFNRMSPPVREIHRAWSRVGRGLFIRDALCLIIQEDDSYRFRVQDMAEYFNPNRWWKRLLRLIKRESYRDSIKRDFSIALGIIEHCEVIDDMKERQRLLKRILLTLLEDKVIGKCFEEFCREVNWKKLYLKESDRYHFRAKYYKADYRLFDY